MNEATDRLEAFRKIFRSWFELTADEQKALLLVLILFLLGLTVRFWHLKTEKPEILPRPSGSAEQTPRM